MSRLQRGKQQRFRRKRRGLATVGLVVEGDAEFEALPLLHKKNLIPNCPPLKASNLGGVGEHRTAEGIAKLVAPKVLAHLVAGRRKVVVCFDREHRAQTAGCFAQDVLRELQRVLSTCTIPHEWVKIVVADRAFEAWILADAVGLFQRRVFKRSPNFFSFEGQVGLNREKGKADIAYLLQRTYQETYDGPNLFCSVDFPTARDHGAGKRGSRSLDKFLRTLGV